MTGLQMMFEKVNKPDSDMDEEEQCRPLMAASRAKQSKLQQEIERKNAEMSRSVKESKQVERELWEVGSVCLTVTVMCLNFIKMLLSCDCFPLDRKVKVCRQKLKS